MLKNYSANMDKYAKQHLFEWSFQRLQADPEEPFEDLIIELAAEIEYLNGVIKEMEKDAKQKAEINEKIFNRMKRKIVENMNTSKEVTESTELTAELNVAAADPFIKSSVGELNVAGDLYISISNFETVKDDPND